MNTILKQKSSIIDQLRERPIPYYDHFLHLQGYEPYEILQAQDSPKDRAILEQHQRRHYGTPDVNAEVKFK